MTDILNQLEINHTFFIQFLIFGAFFSLMSFIYLKPFQRLLEKRSARLNDDVASAAELLKTVDQKLKQYEEAILNTRITAAKQYEEALSAVRAKEEHAIALVKEDLKKDYARAAHLLQEEKLKVESELKLQVNQMSDSAVSKILGGH